MIRNFRAYHRDRDVLDPSILIVGNYSTTTGYAWNNIYRLFNVIARSMYQRGVPVCLCFSEVKLPVDFIDDDIPYDVFEYDQGDRSLAGYYRFYKNLRSRNVRYVYFTDKPAFSVFYAFLRAAGVKKIIVHSRISVADPNPAPPEKGIKKILKTLLGYMSILNADRIYAVSDFVRNRLVAKNCVIKDKVVVILNGINIDTYRCGPSRSVNDGPVRIFTGARATKHKGILTLIYAADRLRHSHHVDNFLIEYAGAGPDLEEFQTVVRGKGLDRHFTFLGELRSTADYVCDADILVVPSNWGDACPSAVSEALASGRALITTTAGGIPQMVGDESNAILVPPGDEYALSDALSSLIRDGDKRKCLGLNGRSRAENAFDERNYYQTVINQLLLDLFPSTS
jgi:glycosyltransferase involved in cell wall biosynthesis